jgi:hypothetical protein
MKTNGTITYSLTRQAADNADGSPISGLVWYGTISVYHPSGLTQSLNWSKPDCATTEIGMNLALSAYPWCGGLVAPTDWSENRGIILAATADNVSYQVLNNLAFIHYENYGQVTDLMYDMPTGVLIFAKTSMGAYWLEIHLDAYAPSQAIPGFEPFLVILTTTLVVATIITMMKKHGKIA